jgi:glycosyltransferase involved in cell wall biosynthesis
VAADDVFVYHRGGGSFGRSDEVERRRYEHEQIIQNRYPYYGHWVRRSLDDDSSSLAAALLAARRSLLGLRIAVDGLCLGPLQAGTQLGIVETVRALAVRDDVTEVVLYTPTVVPSYVSDAVSSLARVTLVPKLAAEPKEPVKIIPCDVVYRGYQVREPNEIEWLRLVGERTVVNWLDLIAYYDAAYFAGDKDWRRYRDLAKLSAYTVDGLAFISEHSRQEAEHAGLLQSGVTTRIVPNGTDHTAATKAPSVAPGIAAALQPGFIFCPGVAYLHKNRVFALAVLAELDALGWKGSLVLAGANPPHGSSLAAEAEFLLKHPELSERVVSIGAFSEGEKTWLYENSGLVIYPTTSEGFGLIPFEAAFYGRACLSSRMGSLDEVLGPDVPGFTEFDPASVAKTALGLLDDEAAAATLVQQTLTRAADFTWAEAAEGVVALADEVIRRPSSRVVAIRGEAGLAGLDEFSELARNRGRRGRAAVDAMVGYFVERPALRQRIVPPNSGRQQFVRKSINVVKSKL